MVWLDTRGQQYRTVSCGGAWTYAFTSTSRKTALIGTFHSLPLFSAVPSFKEAENILFTFDLWVGLWLALANTVKWDWEGAHSSPVLRSLVLRHPYEKVLPQLVCWSQRGKTLQGQEANSQAQPWSAKHSWLSRGKILMIVVLSHCILEYCALRW